MWIDGSTIHTHCKAYNFENLKIRIFQFISLRLQLIIICYDKTNIISSNFKDIEKNMQLCDQFLGGSSKGAHWLVEKSSHFK